MERKQTSRPFYLKAPSKGEALVRFCTFNVPDLEGDVILPSAIGRQDIRISAFNHASWSGELPAGRGRTYERGGTEGVAELEFFMNTTAGRDTFETIKGLGRLGEWSFGYEVEAEEAPSAAQRAEGVRRILKKLKVHEVSPVLKGAGISTATLSAKAARSGNGAGTLDRTELQRAKAGLQAADRILDRTPGVLIRPGVPAPVEFTGRPSAEAKRFARFAVAVAWRLHRKLLHEEPAVRWFRPDALPWGSGDVVGLAYPAGFIALRDDLEGQEAAEVALHEVRHLCQRGVKFADGETEQDAAGFARRWMPVVLRACRETSGHLSKLAVVDTAKPSGRAPHLDVHISRPTGRLWQFDAHTMGEAWKMLAPADYREGLHERA